ncbi:MAG: DHH family phosphoesterase [Butyrivibrio sp.]|uniref:DHH family phosphoesterase n=1 Tax=Butyrivibrio sp. TaxID=28121 RepID=UPI001B6C6F0C|nr:DHH family phosphoesterase [Butyrivibrio sp.]MBP3783476.1 DHH family phosphoesterase [Butyrivibrio sp.]
MKLKDLCSFNNIVIQCHDNPDADALASGFGLYTYFKSQGKDVRFIYRGRNKIQKSNLMIMLDELNIPVEYEPDFDDEPELLVCVDCQYGQRNVTTTKAKNVAIIDHHQKTVELPALSEVRSNIGSASTVVWDMICAEGDEAKELIADNKDLSTALYYGLYTDTNKLSEVSHPLDRDMLDDLSIEKSLIVKMSNSNISLGELKITGKAILGYEYYGDRKYMIINAEPCDPNILGVMSDFSLETAGVDICLAYYERPEEVKFSVRSCTKEVHANELAAFLAEGIGGGGGHIYKAGGSIRPEKIDDFSADEIFKERMQDYFDSFDVIYAEDTTLDSSDMLLYEKVPVDRGCAKLTDLFPVGTLVSIRTLEGDVDVKVEEDLYVMIGIEGEIYPIKEEKLLKSYTMKDTPYEATFEYPPSIKDISTGKKKHLMEYSRSLAVVGASSTNIYARPLKKGVKVFTAWDKEKYYLGNVGDYIAFREDDPHDIYVIKGSLFDRLYRKAT